MFKLQKTFVQVFYNAFYYEDKFKVKIFILDTQEVLKQHDTCQSFKQTLHNLFPTKLSQYCRNADRQNVIYYQ